MSFRHSYTSIISFWSLETWSSVLAVRFLRYDLFKTILLKSYSCLNVTSLALVNSFSPSFGTVAKKALSPSASALADSTLSKYSLVSLPNSRTSFYPYLCPSLSFFRTFGSLTSKSSATVASLNLSEYILNSFKSLSILVAFVLISSSKTNSLLMFLSSVPVFSSNCFYYLSISIYV